MDSDDDFGAAWEAALDAADLDTADVLGPWDAAAFERFVVALDAAARRNAEERAGD